MKCEFLFRLGWMGVFRWKVWIRLGCSEGISRLYGFGSDSFVFFFLAEYFGRLVGTIDDFELIERLAYEW